jgi:acetyl-CoA acetyltransferase
MRANDEAVIIGAGTSPYRRRPTGRTTYQVLFDAVTAALRDAGLALADVDGFAVSSYSLAPDHAVDFAWQLGSSPRWLMEDRLGGVNGITMIRQAVRAVEAGDASVIVVVAGDHLEPRDFARLADTYTRPVRDHLAPLPYGGFNTAFAMLTQRHMAEHGLTRTDYGQLVVAQRRWAAGNPAAAYRAPLSLRQYLDAEVIADPLSRLDCVPVVTGADAVVVATRNRARSSPTVRIRAQTTTFNHDNQEGSGLSTGLRAAAPAFWDASGIGPRDADVLSIYDDYPAMVLVQLQDLGYIPDGDVARFVKEDVVTRPLALNTSGGQLCAGQAGAAAGMHGPVEIVQQLRGRAGARQVSGAGLGLVAGYGSFIYRHASCSGAMVLEVAP